MAQMVLSPESSFLLSIGLAIQTQQQLKSDEFIKQPFYFHALMAVLVYNELSNSI